MNPACIICYESFNPRRLELGYRTCLDCGAHAANRERPGEQNALHLLITREPTSMLARCRPRGTLEDDSQQRRDATQANRD